MSLKVKSGYISNSGPVQEYLYLYKNTYTYMRIRIPMQGTHGNHHGLLHPTSGNFGRVDINSNSQDSKQEITRLYNYI